MVTSTHVFSQNDATRVTINDSSQSHFCKISEPLVDKPSMFAYKEMIIFWSSNDLNWCKISVLAFKSCYAIS